MLAKIWYGKGNGAGSSKSLILWCYLCREKDLLINTISLVSLSQLVSGDVVMKNTASDLRLWKAVVKLSSQALFFC